MMQQPIILCRMESSIAIIPPKTAIHRADLSRPMKSALHDGLIGPTVTVFDYGCGQGELN